MFLPCFPQTRELKELYLGSELFIECFASVVFMAESKIGLYVKSVKTVTGTVETEHEVFGPSTLDRPSRVKIEGKASSGTFRLRQFAIEKEPKYEFILSEDQQKIVETVKDISRRYSLEVEVVDIARENVLRRIIKQKQEKIKIFPTLITDSGRRIEGKMTDEKVESFLSRIANERMR